jgi:transposase
MGHWAKPPIDPDQPELLGPPLRRRLDQDHPVHLFDEILDQYDWSPWENEFVLVEGQPPIHPRYIAGPITYGLTVGVRSTRALEGACITRLDFTLLARGHQPDHSTFGNFRTRFKDPIHDLFRFISTMAIGMGLARLNQVGLDGTRVRANSSRRRTATARTLDERLAAVDQQVAELLARAEQEDREEDTLFGKEVSPHRLSRELANVQRRQEALAQALANARAQEAKRQAKKGSSAKAQAEDGGDAANEPPSESGDSSPNRPQDGAAEAPSTGAESAPSPKPKAPKVPVADPDSTIQPNKEGGFAPNYTPMAVVDTQGGFILDADVLATSDEGQATVAMLDRLEETHGQRPDELLADSKHGSGPTLEALDERGITAFIPLEQRHDTPDNPAHRTDPSVPVPEADWPRLPRSPVTGKLDRAAFIHDEKGDCYWCPQGHRLPFWHEQKVRGGTIARAYRCEACAGCPLGGECLAGKSRQRSITRDPYEPLREAMDARLRTPEGRATYERRRWACETPFAVIKTVMGVRQFLLRGLDKVRTEWKWVCSAYNLRKLVWGIARQRGYAWAQP